MKIVVIGGSGLIGSKVVAKLGDRGHEVVAASPNTGVNTITGEGLAEAMQGAEVVIDVANSPSFAFHDALVFFRTSGRNLMAAEKTAGVRHHLALSVVGTERLLESGYFQAKLIQENLIKASGIPYTILHSTQFFEFIGRIAESGVVNGEIHLSPALIQPIASDDVASALAELALGPPLNATVEVAGPDKWPLNQLAEKLLTATGDRRYVVSDAGALYYGARLDDQSLVPSDHPRFGPTSFDDWLRRQPAH
jgi:uncharacterized protein YbjT (DUF2867 family)